MPFLGLALALDVNSIAPPVLYPTAYLIVAGGGGGGASDGGGGGAGGFLTGNSNLTLGTSYLITIGGGGNGGTTIGSTGSNTSFASFVSYGGGGAGGSGAAPDSQGRSSWILGTAADHHAGRGSGELPAGRFRSTNRHRHR